jgi:hypothetical protein
MWKRRAAPAPRSVGWLPKGPELSSVRRAANGIVATATEFDSPTPPRAFDFLKELEPDFKQVRAPFTRCHSQSLPVVGPSRHGQKSSPIWLRTGFQPVRWPSRLRKGPLGAGSVYGRLAPANPHARQARPWRASPCRPLWCDQIPTLAENQPCPHSQHTCAHRHSQGSGKLW